MPTHKVNLDALIQREDFESNIDESASHAKAPLFKIAEMKRGALYFSVLRKPDFQRTTNNWTPEMIVDFVQTALDDEFYPALILWHSKQTNKVFVIDGAHRLGAIIGWVNDDYGNGEISRAFFGNDILPAQVAFHNKTKALMDQRIGLYETVLRAGNIPTATDDPDMVRRGRAIATFQPQIQIVQGDAKVAERSFLKINSNPATIDATDLDIIRARRKPNAIATRALMRAGSTYFAKLEKAKEIDELAREVYNIIFGQIVEIGPQSPDIPKAGQPYSDEAFKTVLDIVNIFNGITPAMWQQSDRKKPAKGKEQAAELANDADGRETIKYLERVKDVGTLVSDDGSRNAGSLGLDQAVYSYGDTGKFHPAAFLASLKFSQDLEKEDKKYQFTDVRKDFEEFIVQHKFFINQLGHSKGSRTRPLESILTMHKIVLDCIVSGTKDHNSIVAKLKANDRLKELNDVTNLPVKETKRKKFSKSAQIAAVVRQILENRERCTECGARLPPGCRSKDHKIRVEDGGKGTSDNLQFTHPYCNTGYKERKIALSKQATAGKISNVTFLPEKIDESSHS